MLRKQTCGDTGAAAKKWIALLGGLTKPECACGGSVFGALKHQAEAAVGAVQR